MYKKYLVITSLVLTLLFTVVYAGKSKLYIETCSNNSTEVSDSIRETIDSYIVSFNEGDCEKILSYFCEETLETLDIDMLTLKENFESAFNSQGKIDEYTIQEITPANNNIMIATVDYVMNNTQTSEKWVFKNVDNHWKLNNGVLDITEINSSLKWHDLCFTTNNLIHSIDDTTLLTISFTNNNINTLTFGLINKAQLIVTTTETTYYTPILTSSKYATNSGDIITSSYNNFSGEIIKIELQGIYLLDPQGNPIKDYPNSITLYEI